MRHSTIALLAAAVFVLPLATAAQAQNSTPACEGDRIFDRLPKPPNGCQRERIQASGGLRPGESFARSSAANQWRHQVLTKYGERFQKLDNAACARSECVPGAIAGLTRCTISAIPCATAPQAEGTNSAVGDLSEDEIKEMQRLLGVKQDGKFGRGTVEALQRWQRRHRLFDDGEPNKENLERLRKG